MRNKKQKLTALLLTLTMLFTGVFPVMSFAEVSAEYTVVLEALESEVIPGGEVSVDVLFQSESRSAAPDAAEIHLSYDSEKLTYQRLEPVGIDNIRAAERDGNLTIAYLTDNETGPVSPLTEGQILVARIVFQAQSAGTEAISPISTVVTVDQSLKDMECEGSGTSITIKEGPIIVYLDGIDGDDENNGNSESTAVKTFARAKELLQKDGEIHVTGTVLVNGTESWSLPEEEYGTAKILFKQTGDKGEYGEYHECIRVNQKASLTLQDIVIEGYQGSPGPLILCWNNLVVNSGTVLKDNNPTNVYTAGAIYLVNGECTVHDIKIENCESGRSVSVIRNGGTLNLNGGMINGSVVFGDYNSTITPVSDLIIGAVYSYQDEDNRGQTIVKNDARNIQEVSVGGSPIEVEDDGTYILATATKDIFIRMKEAQESSLSVDKSPVYFYAGKDFKKVDGSLTTQTITVTNEGNTAVSLQISPEEDGYFEVSQPKTGSLEAGESTTFAISPDSSKIQDLDAGSQVSSGITISGDDGSEVTLYAIFTLLNAYTATVTCGENGSLRIDPDQQSYDQYLICEDGSAVNLYKEYANSYYPVGAGETVRLLINDSNTFGRQGLQIQNVPDSAYRLDKIRIYRSNDPEGGVTYTGSNNVLLGPVPLYVEDFDNANADIRVDVTFVKKSCSLTYKVDENSAGSSAGGRLEGPASVEYGDDAEILLIPDDGYYLSESGVNGAGVSVDIDEDGIGTLKLENITTDTEVAAIFEPDPPEVAFRKHSLLLSGRIGVNFYLELPVESGETAEEKYKDSYVEFTVSGKTQRCVFDPERMDRDHQYYGFICKVNSIQMAEEITAVYHYGDDQIAEHKTDPDDPDKVTAYSVEKYVDTFRKLESGFDEETRTLVYALADYGHYIQPFLSEVRGWTIGTDYKEMPGANVLTEADVNAAKEAVSNEEILRASTGTGIDKVAFSMTLDTDTALNFYLTPSSGYDGEVTAYQDQDGSQKNIAEKKGDRWLVCVPGISAHKLGDDYLVHVKTGSGEFDLRASAMSYVNLLFKSSYADDEDAKYAMTALYNYYKAADAVVKE